MPIFGGLWAVGFVTVLGVTVLNQMRLRRRVLTQTTQATPRTLGLFNHCCRQMQVRARVELRVGTWVRAPAVCGIRHPTLLLPACVESDTEPSRLRHILLHELAHVARYDLHWGLLLRLVQALHWFNPLVSWLLRRMRLEREIATDAKVLEVTGEAERSAYGETLLMLLGDRTERLPVFGVSAVGTTDDPADMEKRIRAIAGFISGRARSRIALPLIAVLAVVCWTNATTPPVAPATGKSTPVTGSGALALIPGGDDLGAGWSNRITSLVDRGTPPLEYFDPGVFEPARESIRSSVAEGGTFCDVSYFRAGNFVFEAWLRRAASTNIVEEQWNRLRDTPLIPRLSDGRVAKRSFHHVGDLEAILYEDGSRTLWMTADRWILNLNIYAKMPVDEVLSIGEVFARRLAAGKSGAARRVEEPVRDADAWYTVHAIGDLHTPVRRVHTNRVALSRAFTKPDDARAYITITNSEDVPILVWNVRVQVAAAGSEDKPDGWKTVSSNYPSCASRIPAGTTADECVLPPLRVPWRVALLYTAQPLDGGRTSEFPAHLRGDHEIISATQEPVFD